MKYILNKKVTRIIIISLVTLLCLFAVLIIFSRYRYEQLLIENYKSKYLTIQQKFLSEEVRQELLSLKDDEKIDELIDSLNKINDSSIIIKYIQEIKEKLPQSPKLLSERNSSLQDLQQTVKKEVFIFTWREKNIIVEKIEEAMNLYTSIDIYSRVMSNISTTFTQEIVALRGMDSTERIPKYIEAQEKAKQGFIDLKNPNLGNFNALLDIFINDMDSGIEHTSNMNANRDNSMVTQNLSNLNRLNQQKLLGELKESQNTWITSLLDYSSFSLN